MQALILVLASLGVFQALFLSVYLLNLKKGKRLANVFLAIVLIGLSIRIGKSIFNHFLEIEHWQRNLGLAGILLVGPSFWLYGKALSNAGVRLHKQTLAHYIPFALFVLFCWWIPNNFGFGAKVSYMLVMTHMLAYLIVGNNLRRKVLLVELSPELHQWFVKLTIGLSVLWLYYVAVFFGLANIYIGGAITYTALIYVMSYLILNKQDMFAKRYANSAMDRSASQILMDKIDDLFSEQQVYLDKTLNLEKVSTLLNQSSRDVSQAINEVQNLNFSEYVKRHRVEHAKALLTSETHQNQKMLGIALDSGFGNITSFNTAFKSLVEKTPSQFRQDALTR